MRGLTLLCFLIFGLSFHQQFGWCCIHGYITYVNVSVLLLVNLLHFFALKAVSDSYWTRCFWWLYFIKGRYIIALCLVVVLCCTRRFAFLHFWHFEVILMVGVDLHVGLRNLILLLPTVDGRLSTPFGRFVYRSIKTCTNFTWWVVHLRRFNFLLLGLEFFKIVSELIILVKRW